MSWLRDLPRVAIIGSRETPEEILGILRRLGKTLCDLNIGITSGDADGADLAGFEGFSSSPNYKEGMARIYLPWRNMFYSQSRRQRVADGVTFIDSPKLELYQQAQELAYKTRGSFNGLGPGGIAMHTRNVFQVLQDDLRTPVRSVVLYAKPKQYGTAVSGGTNTAFQIAVENDIPTLNLATQDGLERALTYLERNGQ